MIEDIVVGILQESAYAAVFVYFLHKTFQQRAKTTGLMIEMMRIMVSAITSCCEHDEEVRDRLDELWSRMDYRRPFLETDDN